MPLQPSSRGKPALHLSEGIKRALRGPAGPACHPGDLRLLTAMQYLRSEAPMVDVVWNELRSAARRGDLFVVTREAGNSEDRLARLQRKQP